MPAIRLPDRARLVGREVCRPLSPVEAIVASQVRPDCDNCRRRPPARVAVWWEQGRGELWEFELYLCVCCARHFAPEGE